MYRIDNATAVTPIPAPAAVGPNPNCFFFKGNPGSGIPATIVDDDWANAVQEELCNAITGFGVTLDKTKRDQLSSILLGTGGFLRKRLAADTTFYVRSDGSNANTGLVNNAGGAWLTLQFALDFLNSTYDSNAKQITIQLNAGTFVGYVGAATTPGQTKAIIVNGVGATTIISSAINIGSTGGLIVQNLKFVCASSDCLIVGVGGYAAVGVGVEFGACAGNNHLLANGGRIDVLNNMTVSGGAFATFRGANNGIITVAGAITITLSGTPAYSGACASFDIASTLVFGQAGGAAAFSGAATGVRYAAANLSLISTSGAGATYIPGNSAGAVATSAVYS